MSWRQRADSGRVDCRHVVEVAYSIDPEHQRKGYATEAARAAVAYAFGTGQVRTVRAHTLPDGVASQRVLEKCGFSKTSEVMDPEDGLVWRFEISRSDVPAGTSQSLTQ